MGKGQQQHLFALKGTGKYGKGGKWRKGKGNGVKGKSPNGGDNPNGKEGRKQRGDPTHEPTFHPCWFRHVFIVSLEGHQ